MRSQGQFLTTRPRARFRLTRVRWTLAICPTARLPRASRRGEGLEWNDAAHLLCAVRRPRDVAGITAGVIAASATAGSLLGFGIHVGAPARLFNAVAGIVLGQGVQGESAFSAGPTLIGVLLHVTGMIVLGVLYAVLVWRWRGYTLAWSGVMAAVALAVFLVLARLFGVGPAAVLPIGKLIVLGVVLALALPIGMRLALSRL